jgi:hypothetical protein
MEIDLRTESILYNHGGYYAPGDPTKCNTPGGPCGHCQKRIELEKAIETLANLKETLPKISTPLIRHLTLGVQSPKIEEKKENK